MVSNSLLIKLTKIYDVIVRIENKFQNPILLLMRLYWGWQFYLAGKGKLLNLAKTTDFFSSIGIPAPHLNAIMAGSTECFGGLLLLIGLGSRLVSIPLIFTMLVAYLTAHLDVVKNIFNNPEDFIAADPFLFMLTALLIFAFGPGIFSVDAIIRKFMANQLKKNSKTNNSI